MFQRLNRLNDRVGDQIGGFQELIAFACCVGQQDSKEDGWLACPVVAKRVADVDHERLKLALYVRDGTGEFGLMSVRLGYGHNFIITRRKRAKLTAGGIVYFGTESAW